MRNLETKHKKSLNKRQWKKSQKQELELELTEKNMENEMKGAAEPSRKSMDIDRDKCSDDLIINIKSNEEHFVKSKKIYKCVRAPRRSHSSSQDLSFEEDHLRVQAKSKKIAKIKNTKKKTEIKQKSRSSRRVDSKENHLKYTVKTPSNYLRAKLKKSKFEQFSKLEKEDRKRASRIYLNIMLLQLRNRLGNQFPQFIDLYQSDLDRRITKHMNAFGQTERNKAYIEDFNKAKISTSEFLKGNYIKSIEAYFGTKKEKFYLKQSILYFTEWKKKIGDCTLMTEMGEEFIFEGVEF